MKVSRAQLEGSAFTLLELLLIIVIVCLLVFLIIPIGRHGDHTPGIQCMNQLKQLTLGFIMYATDNTNQFPMQVSVANGGTMEFIKTGHEFPHFEKIHNYFPLPQGGQLYQLLVCPAEKNRKAATNAAGFSDANISYFLNVDAQCTNQPSHVILMGDRDLKANGQAVSHGLLTVTTNMDLGWTEELHRHFGNIAFADGHVERIIAQQRLNIVFANQPLTTNRLVVP